MLMISKEAMESVIAIKDRLAHQGSEAECIADIENMIEIKQSHLARAEWGSCCGNICNLVSQIDNEIGMLQNILEALSANNNRRAASLLGDYIAYLQENYRPEPDHW
ncbi:MAG: hypothetical protein CO103_01135 [Chloroflexi bacterium CG_4_9_14_3_um_filter_45_9]|nr:MAG: hypothetical protein AUK00_01990 [Dehalococcoidia bacterium CG2_30_46_9]PIU23087.1 MAG: hypothetical protein COT13_04955 [Chloroflexi bacterium CG08_land_8_20_14_0_20_45_12]PIX27208.1 MAG: hypothetical protein COZ67_03560 [Chloroflexi bacterium CG_4_8_14_3_um_filter_45_15]PJB50913.1 MAG: hypothetical protein CO103_01135 [Chloroflexi bacterium CG_4_9_14_3_um_filter_45_9]